MRFLIIILLLLGLVFFIGCKTTKEKSDETLSQISFGSYGGISADGFEYTLREDALLQKISLPSQNIVGSITIDKELCDQLFTNYEFLKLEKITLSEPGNRTNFIQMKNMNGEHLLKWPVGKLDLSQEVKTYFKLLNQLPNKYKILEHE